MAESNAGSIYNNERWREEREKEEGREEGMTRPEALNDRINRWKGRREGGRKEGEE